MEEADVVVIGAGPAGSSAARRVAEAGCSVIMLEMDRFAGETSVCAGGLEESYMVDGMDIPDWVVEKKISKWLMYLPDETYMLERSTLSFQRSIFDEYLSEEAARRGVDFRISSRATDVLLIEDGVIVGYKGHDDQNIHEIKAGMVIFADGPNTLAHKFDLGFPRKQPKKTSVAAIYELEYNNNQIDNFEFFFDERITPWGYGWIFPKKDTLNVGVGCLISKLAGGSIRSYLDYFVNSYPIAADRLNKLKKIRFAAAIIPGYYSPRISTSRMLAAGDAAGMVDPIWGGGIASAIKGGLIAGEVASSAVENQMFGREFLSLYDKRWKNTEDYKRFRMAYYIQRAFLEYSRIDKNAFCKMISWILGKAGAKKI